MHTGIIDRFESNLAVIELETGSTTAIDKNLLPTQAQIGDQLIFHDDQSITVDEAGTKQLKKDIEELAEDLFEE